MSNVDFKVSVEIDGQKLNIAYSINNKSEEDIFIFDVIWRPSESGIPELDPNEAYISLGKDGLLRIGKIVHPTPREKFVEMTIVPFVHRVAKKEKYDGIIVLSMPVQEYNPYYPADQETEWEDAVATSLEFLLNWVVDSDEMRVDESPVGNGLRVTHPKLLGILESFRSEKFFVNVAVKKRIDKFERF